MDPQEVYYMVNEIDETMVEMEMYVSTLSIIVESLSGISHKIPFLEQYENALSVTLRGLNECCAKGQASAARAFSAVNAAKEHSASA